MSRNVTRRARANLPLVREVIDRIGNQETIDRMLPRDGRMDVSDADCVSLMIINILGTLDRLFRLGADDVLSEVVRGYVAAHEAPAE